MATFKPGQLVKKIKPLSTPTSRGFPAGTVGVVLNGLLPGAFDLFDISVRANGLELNTVSDWWEPVQYDGNQASSWDVGVWKPSHLRENLREKENDSVLEVQKEAATATD